MGHALATVNVVLEVETCCACGTSFAFPDTLQRAARRDPSVYFYCPLGHSQHYSEGEAGRLRKQLDAQIREATLQAQRAAQAQQERDAALALQAKAERKLKRVQNGVCPCCNRTFQNLAQHMATQHPEKSAAAPPVDPSATTTTPVKCGRRPRSARASDVK
jgi:hypothetical protein